MKNQTTYENIIEHAVRTAIAHELARAVIPRAVDGVWDAQIGTWELSPETVRAALHEAAHTVVAWVLSLDPVKVSIADSVSNRYYGVVGRMNYASKNVPVSRKSAVVIAPIAIGDDYFTDYDRDDLLAMNLSPQEYQRAEKTAKVIIGRHWRQLATIASELIVNRVLHRDDINRIMLSAPVFH